MVSKCSLETPLPATLQISKNYSNLEELVFLYENLSTVLQFPLFSLNVATETREKEEEK